jgi:hypothetical protein
MEPSHKEDILPLKEVTRMYFLRVLDICGGNRTETARVLKINIRTVRNYCTEFGVPSPQKQIATPDAPATDEDFNCMIPVTPLERDEWYNRDRF